MSFGKNWSWLWLLFYFLYKNHRIISIKYLISKKKYYILCINRLCKTSPKEMCGFCGKLQNVYNGFIERIIWLIDIMTHLKQTKKPLGRLKSFCYVLSFKKNLPFTTIYSSQIIVFKTNKLSKGGLTH